jgi:uncharacterized repeat protein (TIGR03803 family)
MTAAGAVTVLHTFQGSDGKFPAGALVAGTDGFFYGITQMGGGFDAGTIFKIDSAGNFSTIYTFTGGADGRMPLDGLMLSKDGSLYGTASFGGTGGNGVVFRIKKVVPQPFITIDLPGTTTANPVYVAGWALDHGAFTGTGIDAIHVYAFPNYGSGTPPIFLGVANYGTSRSDIGSIFGTQFTNVGYSVASTLAPGTYLIAAFGLSSVTGTFATVATKTVTVVTPQSLPAMALDVPASGATVAGNFVVVAGWALDRGAPSSTGVSTVHVWALPANGNPALFLGVASYGVSRPDIGGLFGSAFTNSGYVLVGTLPPGSYTIAAFALSTVTNTFNNVRTANVIVQ